jgi:two-component system LytT family sensor kinase
MIIKNKWGWLFLALTLLALLNIGVIATDDLANGDEVHWLRHIINELSGSWLILPLLPGLLWFFKKFPITRDTFWTRLPLHLFMTLAFGTTHTLLMYAVRTPIYEWVGLGDYGKWYGILEYRMAMEYFKQVVVYWVFYGAFLFFEKIKENQRRQIQAAQLEEQLTKARLQSLQMQLNPHFLFNTLNAISGMMYEDIDAADNMMTTLSDMLRSTLHIRIEEHRVEQELALLDRYLEIMKIRFKDQLHTRLEVEERAKQALVPVFLLQPLMENAIKYGVEKNGKVIVQLAVKTYNERLSLRVEDNGPGIQSAFRNGIGWNNTLERLEKLFGEDHLFNLENKAEGGLRVTVEIPLHFENT